MASMKGLVAGTEFCCSPCHFSVQDKPLFTLHWFWPVSELLVVRGSIGSLQYRIYCRNSSHLWPPCSWSRRNQDLFLKENKICMKFLTGRAGSPTFPAPSTGCGGGEGGWFHTSTSCFCKWSFARLPTACAARFPTLHKPLQVHGLGVRDPCCRGFGKCA